MRAPHAATPESIGTPANPASALPAREPEISAGIAGGSDGVRRRSSPRSRLLALLPALALSACTTVQLDPLMQSDIEQRVKEDAAEMQAESAPVTAPITLAEAVARSLKFNLDNRLKLMEVIVADDRLNLSHYDLLPRLAAEAGYSYRSNENAASSESIRTRRESLEPSTSQDRGLTYANLETSWNVLDFGINYLSSRQAGNQVLITVERERKIVQNIVKDVRYAYWRLVGARRLQQQLVPLIGDVQSALDRAREIEAGKLRGTKDALEYQRRLLELKRELVRLEQDLHEARIELTALMGLPPGTQFTLADEQSAREAAELTALLTEDPVALHQFALRSRPELLEEDYRTRIAQLDVEKARWSWVPGFELYAGAYYDDNSYLVNEDWALYGVRLTWNIIKALQAPSAIRTAEDEKRLADIRRMALSAAVMTQVDVAALRYKLSSQTFSLNRELLDVDQRLLDQVQKEYEAKTTDELAFLETRARRLVAQLRHDIALAEWHDSAGQLLVSLGYEPAPVVDIKQPLATLTTEMQGYLDNLGKPDVSRVHDGYAMPQLAPSLEHPFLEPRARTVP